MSEEKVGCRTPAEGRDGVTNIPKWKFDVLHAGISTAIAEAGAEGLRFSDLKDAVRPKIDAGDLERLGSLGWHVTSVKLEMEVRGDVVRLDGKGPQRMVLGHAG